MNGGKPVWEWGQDVPFGWIGVLVEAGFAVEVAAFKESSAF